MMNNNSNSSTMMPPATKKISVTRDINTGQTIILVDLAPGVHLEVLATYDLPPHESYRSFYRKIVASNIWKRPRSSTREESEESSLSPPPGDNDKQNSKNSVPLSSSSTSLRGTKRKASNPISNPAPHAQREVKRRKARNGAIIPPSTRVLRTTK